MILILFILGVSLHIMFKESIKTFLLVETITTTRN